MNSCTI